MPMSVPIEPYGRDPFAVPLAAADLKQTSFRGSLVTAVAQLFRLVLQIGSQAILARLLFPEDFGLLAMVAPLVVLAQVFSDLGFGQAIIQRPTLRQDRVSALLWINLAISILLALVVALLAPLAALMYDEPRVLELLVALAVVLPLSALGVHPLALLSRQMRFGVISRNDIIATLAGSGTTIVGAALGWSFWSLVVGQIAGLAVGNGFNWISCAWRPSRPGRQGSMD